MPSSCEVVQGLLFVDLGAVHLCRGGDVFVDVGNKSLGLEALMRYLSVGPEEVWTSAACPGINNIRLSS